MRNYKVPPITIKSYEVAIEQTKDSRLSRLLCNYVWKTPSFTSRLMMQDFAKGLDFGYQYPSRSVGIKQYSSPKGRKYVAQEPKNLLKYAGRRMCIFSTWTRSGDGAFWILLNAFRELSLLLWLDCWTRKWSDLVYHGISHPHAPSTVPTEWTMRELARLWCAVAKGEIDATSTKLINSVASVLRLAVSALHYLKEMPMSRELDWCWNQTSTFESLMGIVSRQLCRN